MTSNQSKHSIPIDKLNDLCSRFIINIPPEDRDDIITTCFQIELAHWFYLDYICTDNQNKLENCNLKQFATHIFQHLPHLRKHIDSLDSILEYWKSYKSTVPTYGAILLDTDLTHVLLVQSYWTKASWGFPKGKVNESEDPSHCAAREVLEETGFDISNMVNTNDFIETVMHEQIVRLYIVHGIPRDTQFKPLTRNEIKSIEWFPIAALPTGKKDITPRLKLAMSPNTFFMVMPFVKRIRRWISEKMNKGFTGNSIPRRARNKSCGDVESPTFKGKGRIPFFDKEMVFQNSNIKQKSTPKYTPVARKERKNSKRQLFTPQNISSKNAETGPFDYECDEEYMSLINYKSPAWHNFKFDHAAILAAFD